MVQIKLHIAFVLAAAAIAPVVAQPIHERGEFSGHVGRRHHHHHPYVEAPVPQDPSADASPSVREFVDELEVRSHSHGDHQHHHEGGHGGHHDHHYHKEAAPQDLSADANAGQPSRREYADEFEVRALLGGDLNILGSLHREEKTLESQDKHLEQKHHSLKEEDKTLEHKDHHLQSEDKNLEHKRKSVTAQDKSLEGKRGSLERKNKSLGKMDKKLALKGKAVGHHDNVLKHKGKVLAHHNKGLAKEGKVLAHKDKVVAQKGKAHAQATKPVSRAAKKVVAREYDEFDEVFGRGTENTGIEAANKVSPFKASHMGLAVFPHRGSQNGPPLRSGPNVFHPDHQSGRAQRMRIHRGGLVRQPHRSSNSKISALAQRLHFGQERVVQP